VQYDEDLLREILDLSRVRAHSLESREEVVELPLVDLEAAALRRGLWQGRMNLSKITHAVF
jgi:hypothetical protein